MVPPHVANFSGVLLKQLLWDLQGMMSRITGGSRLSATGDAPPVPPQRIATAPTPSPTLQQPTATSSPRCATHPGCALPSWLMLVLRLLLQPQASTASRTAQWAASGCRVATPKAHVGEALRAQRAPPPPLTPAQRDAARLQALQEAARPRPKGAIDPSDPLTGGHTCSGSMPM